MAWMSAPLIDAIRAPKNLVFLVVAAIGVIADQALKAWVVANIELHTGEIMLIDGWLSLVHERNTGAAFSSFEGWFSLFVVFTIVALGVLLDLQRRLKPDNLFMAATLGMILSGALGNFIDRLRFRYVVDMVRCFTEYEPFVQQLASWGLPNTYPIWNIADAAILVGVVLFLLYSTFNADEDAEEATEAESAAATTEAAAEG